MLKGIKKSINIFLNLVASIILIAAIIPITLQFSNIQNYFSDMVASELSQKINSKVSIGQVDYRLFNTIRIKELYVEDLQQDTLLHIEKTYLDFRFRDFFNGKIIFNAIVFDHFTGNIEKYENGKTNFDFILDAFKKPTTNQKSNVEYRIEKIRIKHSNFHYKSSKPANITVKSKFNPFNFQLHDIEADISLSKLASDTISLHVNHIAFNEKSGFELNDLSFQMVGSNKRAIVQYLNLELPHSKLSLSDIQLNYDSLSQFKQFSQKVKFKIPINRSSVNLSDLKVFVPEFEKFTKEVNISAQISGSIASLKIKKLELNHTKSFYLNADIEISGLPSIQDAFIYTDIKEFRVNKNEIQDVVSILSNKPFLLPNELNNLGLINYKGNITGFLSNLVTYGNLKTSVGTISTDILLKFENDLKDLKYSGSLKTNNLKLNKLLNSDKIGSITLNISTKGTKLANKPLKGIVNGKIISLEALNYKYNDITLDGSYDGSGFDGSVLVKDPNIMADFKGVIDLSKKIPIFDFDLKVDNANFNALNFTKLYPGSTLSFVGKTNITGKTADDINGYAWLKTIQFVNKNKTLNVDQIQLVSQISNGFTNVNIISDFLNGSVSGNFTYSKLPIIVNGILQNYLPTLSSRNTEKLTTDNSIAVDLQISNTAALSDVLELPFQLNGITTLQGNVSNTTNAVNLKADIPQLNYNKQAFEHVSLRIENENKILKLNSRGQLLQKKGIISLYANALASSDTISSTIGWQSDSKKITNAGEIAIVSRLRSEEGKIAANMQFNPSQIIISDSIWNIQQSSIDLNPDSSIRINKFRFENNTQFIFADGLISNKTGNNIQFTLNDINLNFIFQLLKLKSINIGGRVTGTASLLSSNKMPVFLADLQVKNATLNKSSIGNAHIKSTWDNDKSQMLLNADFVKDNNDSIGRAKGIFEPKTDSLDVVFDLKGLPISFLQPYFEGVVSNVNGYGYGKLRMFGPTKTISFEGLAFIDKAQMTVNALKTSYYFNDTVRLTKKTIELRNVEFYDAERNRGNLNGLVQHNGLFQKMNYNVNISANNLIGLDTQARDNDYFYGKAYVSGTVNITGNDNEASIIVNATTQPKSKAFIQMGGASTASDNTFITFENPAATTESTLTKVVDKNRFNTKVDLNIDVTPDADMQLIVDPKAGDAIAGHGIGSLRVKFDTFSDIKLYGTYTINSGYYLFTLQTIVRKEFKIDNGSTLTWTGNPFGAKVNIRGIYPLTASLSNIIDNAELSSSTRRTSMPVNCILKLTGDLMAPTIKFEIDLPTADESLKQRVRSVIDTEEMMNRQIAYLLVANSFYNPAVTTAANQAVINSFVTSTLSANLNNFIQKTFKSDLVSLGFDWQQTNTTENQYKAQVMLQPNDRISLNGNVGIRDDNFVVNPEDRYMWDVDFEYSLTDNGKLRFKAYSHTIDRAQLKEAKTTQGMGFVYKQDFQSVSEMFGYYLKTLSSTFKSKATKKE